jgi:hypothetical protein
MVAFNDGLLDAIEPDAVADRLEDLAVGIRGADLHLTDPREHWSTLVARVLNQGQGNP